MRALVFLAFAVGLAAAQTQTRCQSYVVQQGDTIGGIASKFGVQVTDLEEAQTQCNSGYTPGGFLQLSQTLCLPPYFDACQSVQSAGGDQSCKYYTVQTGDTLASIASSLGLTQLDLQQANPDTTTLQVNDFVKLPGWTDSCPAPGDNTQCRVYIAEQGDSLAGIAIAFSVNVADLQSVNPDLATVGDTAAVLQPGQRINIPPFTAACGAGVIVGKPSTCYAYQVQAGDTLFDIATMFQTTTTLLTQANPALAAGGILGPGTTVYLPPYNPDTCAAGATLRPRPEGFTPLQPGSTGGLIIAGDNDPTAAGGAPAPEEAGMAPAPAPMEDMTTFNRRRQF